MLISFLLLTILAVLLFLLPVIFPSAAARLKGTSARELNIALTEQRLNELDSEKQQSLLDDTAADQIASEQKKNLILEVADEQKSSPISTRYYLPGIVILLVVSIGLYFSRPNYNQVENWLMAQQQLPELAKRAVMQQGEPLSAEEFQNFALALRTKLAEKSDDAVGWLLLGRVSVSLQDLETALSAFERSFQLEPARTSLLVSYSQALMMTGQGEYKTKALGLIRQALILEPMNQEAMALFAYMKTDSGEYKEALDAWKLLLSQVEKEDPRYAGIEAQIEQVTSLVNSKVLTVKVEMQEQLINQIPHNATLFVFAKEYQGKPMPLAVVKQPAGKFPVTVTLSDASAMMPELNLSSVDQITLIARISADDKVTIASGDMQGQIEKVTLNETGNVTVRIDTLL